ncbi:hypothetical protein MMC29_005627 [Sticta canariensis]|nr:hypothetical protein [Sticta canariensis]
MAVASGICEKKLINATSKCAEFLGSVTNTVKALSDMPHGGQVIMDEKTFEGVKLALADLYDMVPHGPSLEMLQQQCRCNTVSFVLDLSRFPWSYSACMNLSKEHAHLVDTPVRLPFKCR